MDLKTSPDAITPRVALWQICREMVGLIMDNLLRLQTWNDQTTYLASQLDIIARLITSLQQEDAKYNVGDVLKLRTLLEAVANAITGCKIPEYAEEELAKLSIPRKDRVAKSDLQRSRRKKHDPATWQYKTEALLLWTRATAWCMRTPTAAFTTAAMDWPRSI